MNAVLLSSGGLDSALLAALNPGALHLSINYGQEHLRELASARNIAAHYSAEHIEKSCRLPHKHGDIVPGRNAVLITLAAAIAQDRSIPTVLIGCNSDDNTGFPDCRPQFINATNSNSAPTHANSPPTPNNADSASTWAASTHAADSATPKPSDATPQTAHTSATAPTSTHPNSPGGSPNSANNPPSSTPPDLTHRHMRPDTTKHAT